MGADIDEFILVQVLIYTTYFIHNISYSNVLSNIIFCVLNFYFRFISYFVSYTAITHYNITHSIKCFLFLILKFMYVINIIVDV